MGAGQSGDQLAVAVISHVIQSGAAELIAIRKHVADAAKKNNEPKFVTRKQFHQAETVYPPLWPESDMTRCPRLWGLYHKAKPCSGGSAENTQQTPRRVQ